jgi:hypothetical protein
MAKRCIQTRYKRTMWEDIGVHDMDQTRPHKLQSTLHKTHGSTQLVSAIDPFQGLQSHLGQKTLKHRLRRLIMVGPSLGVHYNIIHYGLHGFNLHQRAYNGVAK